MSDHVDIYDNEQADKAAKIAAAADYNYDVVDCSNEIDISLIYLKRKAKESLLKSWQNHYNLTAVKKDAYYQNLHTQSAWKSLNLQLKATRIMWSSYMQLKLEHDYFKSYLKRLSDYDSDKYNYNNTSI